MTSDTAYATFTLDGVLSVVSATQVTSTDPEAQAAIQDLGWVVIVDQDQAATLAPVRQQTQSTVVVALIILAIGAVLTIFLAQLLSGPIVRLTAVAEQIAAGNTTAQAKVETGDEIGTLNDYTYRDDPAHERDSRWAHRPRADWEKYAKRTGPNSIEGRVYQGLQSLIKLRKEHDTFSGGELEIIPIENEHILGFIRTHASKRAIIFANFSEDPQTIPARIFAQYSVQSKKHLHGISQISSQSDITIEPLDFVVFG